MGSFGYTCAVSGLPIEAGTPVRFLALTRNRFYEEGKPICEMSSKWSLRGTPIKAVYNDYGSVEDLEPSSITDAFFTSFDQDVVERGVGENSCHDIAVSKGMPHDEWLAALWEGRVLVRADASLLDLEARILEIDATAEKLLGKKSLGETRTPLPTWLPTRRRVEKMLEAKGFKKSRGNFNQGFMATKIRYGYVRVRYEGAGQQEIEQLQEAKTVLEPRFACMIITGSRHYNQAELLVSVAPAKVDSEFKELRILRSPKSCAPSTNLQVSQAMIREDVWQALLRMGSSMTVVDREEAIHELLRYNAEIQTKAPRISQLLHRQQFRGDFAAFNKAFKLAKTFEEQAIVIRAYAEVQHVMEVLGLLRYQWEPRSGGPQFGEWSLHTSFQEAMLKIASQELKNVANRK